MTRLTTFDWIALVLLIIGGVNLGLIGFFDYDLVIGIFGVSSLATRIVYAAVGLSGLYIAFVAPGFERSRTWERTMHTSHTT